MALMYRLMRTVVFAGWLVPEVDVTVFLGAGLPTATNLQCMRTEVSLNVHQNPGGECEGRTQSS